MNTRVWMRKRAYNQQVKQLQTQVVFLWIAIVAIVAYNSWSNFG